MVSVFFFFQTEDGLRDVAVTGVQTCALPIWHPYTFEDQWFFQGRQPVTRARFTLHLPAGWEFRAAWLHHAEQEPQVQGGTYTWDLSDIPRIENEVEMPHLRALAGQVIRSEEHTSELQSRLHLVWR